MCTEAVVSLRIENIINGSVRVGSRPLGGGSGGRTRRLCCISFPGLGKLFHLVSVSGV